MVDATTITRIKCGQIYLLRNNNFALICEFCGREDFYALDVFRLHITDHFPDSEDDTEPPAKAIEVQFVSTVQSGAYDLQTTPAAVNLIKREYAPSSLVYDVSDESSQSECSVRNQRRRKYQKRILTIPSTGSSENANIEKESQSSSTEPLRQMQSMYHNDAMRADAVAGSTGIEEPVNVISPQRCRRTKEDCECVFCENVCASSTSTENPEYHLPYECPICSRMFTEEMHLNEHLKTPHTEELLHACLSCDRRFPYFYQLETHFRETHLPDSDPRRYFECNQCVGKFKSFILWKYHKPCKFRDSV